MLCRSEPWTIEARRAPGDGPRQAKGWELCPLSRPSYLLPINGQATDARLVPTQPFSLCGLEPETSLPAPHSLQGQPLRPLPRLLLQSPSIPFRRLTPRFHGGFFPAANPDGAAPHALCLEGLSSRPGRAESPLPGWHRLTETIRTRACADTGTIENDFAVNHLERHLRSGERRTAGLRETWMYAGRTADRPANRSAVLCISWRSFQRDSARALEITRTRAV